MVTPLTGAAASRTRPGPSSASRVSPIVFEERPAQSGLLHKQWLDGQLGGGSSLHLRSVALARAGLALSAVGRASLADRLGEGASSLCLRSVALSRAGLALSAVGRAGLADQLGEGAFSLCLRSVALSGAGLVVGRAGLADQLGEGASGLCLRASDPSPSPGPGSPLVGLVWLTSRGFLPPTRRPLRGRARRWSGWSG